MMCAEVEVVAGVAPAERVSVGAHALVLVDGRGAPAPTLDPRYAHVIAYYVQKFRDVGHGWSAQGD